MNHWMWPVSLAGILSTAPPPRAANGSLAVFQVTFFMPTGAR